MPLAVLGDEEALAVIIMGHRHHALKQPHHRIFLRLEFLVALQEHFYAGDHEKAAKHVDHPMEIR
ncbi:hypothetical protein D3C83_309500 [compost metagenome]